MDETSQENRERRMMQISAAMQPEIYGKLLRYAAGRCRMLNRVGARIDRNSVEQFVMDAVSDTVLEVRAWDPEKCDLLGHLLGVIRSKTNALIKHALSFHSDSFDYDDGHQASVTTNLTIGSNQNQEQLLIRADSVQKFILELEKIAGSDEQVQYLLLTYYEGLSKRAEIIQELGWTDNDYDNARRRLDRVLRQVSPVIQEEARAILGGQI